jgi:methylated-DNA-[protein]-cysteine S-methyltransferase
MRDNGVVFMKMASPLGPLVLAAEGGALLGAWFDGQEHFDGVDPSWLEAAGDGVLGKAAGQLEEYFAGRRRAFSVPLAPVGTPFQRAVWAAIAAIPFGATAEYGAVAAILGRPGAARAVGTATGRNPWSVIVPCHRMLGRGGALCGYAGGLERKRALLALEGNAS